MTPTFEQIKDLRVLVENIFRNGERPIPHKKLDGTDIKGSIFRFKSNAYLYISNESEETLIQAINLAAAVMEDRANGMVMVPEDATAIMLIAGQEGCISAAMGSSDDYQAKNPLHTETARYKSMLSAAPQSATAKFFEEQGE